MQRLQIRNLPTVLATLVFSLIVAHATAAAESGWQNDKALQIFRSMDNKVATLKQQALEINRDLILIEEESFIPSSAQLVVFFSLARKPEIDVDSVQVKLELDGEVVANHFYDRYELEALDLRAKHRLYLGNLPVGKHRLVAYVDGKGKTARGGFETRTAVDFNKAWDRKFIELSMQVEDKKDAPKVKVNEL